MIKLLMTFMVAYPKLFASELHLDHDYSVRVVDDKIT